MSCRREVRPCRRWKRGRPQVRSCCRRGSRPWIPVNPLCPRGRKDHRWRQRRLSVQKTRWGGVFVLGPSGLASAAAGIIPQASAAARPRRRSEPLRFVGMASPSLVNGKPTPNISLFPRFRNRHPAARHVNRGWARVCATGWAVTARGNHPR